MYIYSYHKRNQNIAAETAELQASIANFQQTAASILGKHHLDEQRFLQAMYVIVKRVMWYFKEGDVVL